MSKYRLGLWLLVLIILTSSGCGNQSINAQNSVSDNSDSEILQGGSYASDISAAGQEKMGGNTQVDLPYPDPNFNPEPFLTQSKSLDESIQTLYEEGDIVERYIDIQFYSALMSNSITLEAVNAAYPIECLRRVDDNRVYAVYKTYEGGFYYMFFWNANGELPEAENGATIGYYNLIGSVYMKNTLSYQDFGAIQMGDPILCVKELELAAGYYENHAKQKMYDTFWEKHVLRDGLFEICYHSSGGKEYKITDIQYYPDFTKAQDSYMSGDNAFVQKDSFYIYSEDYPR